MNTIDNPIKILFLAADPSNASRLRLQQEWREIEQRLQLARQRDKFLLSPSLSVRIGDITQALFDVEPQIVHFSGHGTTAGALCFENLLGQIQSVEPSALAAAFKLFANQVNCVVLNACYSEAQADAIVNHIPFVIGMNQSISDEAAIAFAVGFYKALGANRSIEEAFESGCVEIQLHGIPEHLTPTLKKKNLISPVGIDYTNLQNLLASRKWQEADEETARIMLKVANREKQGWLDRENFERFSCEDLRIIDQFWVKYSNGRFGFSIQKKIWLEVGGKPGVYNEEVWKRFSNRVGWLVKNRWIYYRDFTFHSNASQGHLPGVGGVLVCLGCGDCKLYEWVGNWVWGISALTSRLEICKI